MAGVFFLRAVRFTFLRGRGMADSIELGLGFGLGHLKTREPAVRLPRFNFLAGEAIGNVPRERLPREISSALAVGERWRAYALHGFSLYCDLTAAFFSTTEKKLNRTP